ncbi:MAG: oligopeptide/dipeptide transporter, ATP-binding protein C-terminal domain [Herbinix sp.]|nr:oligopeptide/dipeptide transporter, ATP-binding protein C-terminal domain [Herbinix sp.]
MKDSTQTETTLLEVKDLKKYYPVKGGLIEHTVANIKAVDGVDFSIKKGETLGLVGESGCGKSTIGKLIVSLEKPTAGSIIYKGQDLLEMSARQSRRIRTQLQMVFQDSYSSLNPRKHIYEILAIPMLYHGIATKNNVDWEVNRLLDLVGLPQNSKGRYPHEFSGGQRQRIGIAKALSLKPELIVCDEPVSALDVSIQAQILNLLRELQKELNLTCLFIGHGLGAVNYVSDRIAVMYLGKIVEIAKAKELFANPKHPYTRAICDAAPTLDPTDRKKEAIILPGEIGSNIAPPTGCRFHPRCKFAIRRCNQMEQILKPINSVSARLVACDVVLSQEGGSSFQEANPNGESSFQEAKPKGEISFQETKSKGGEVW